VRPLLLDLFCGAGGCSVGYNRAGFDVVGCDIKPQKNYPFPFVEGDALELLECLLRGGKFHIAPSGPNYWLEDIAAIHASPPCQAYSQANNIHGRTDHPDLIVRTRELLHKTGKPWVIENVPGAPLECPALVCGLALGCGVKRHRLFESNRFLFGTTCPRTHKGDWLLVFGHTVLERGKQIGTTAKGEPIIHRKHVGTDMGRKAMGIDWMSRDELSQAIPPAYTEFVGRQLIGFVEGDQ
jgi:DNA (cytosine-5)-methyltransferase 1